MTKAKAREKKIGDVRKSFALAAVWRGSSRTQRHDGVHAVAANENVLGARQSLCDLTGRFFVDERLTAATTNFEEVGVDLRCPTCHDRWLNRDHE